MRNSKKTLFLSGVAAAAIVGALALSTSSNIGAITPAYAQQSGGGGGGAGGGGQGSGGSDHAGNGAKGGQGGQGSHMGGQGQGGGHSAEDVMRQGEDSTDQGSGSADQGSGSADHGSGSADHGGGSAGKGSGSASKGSGSADKGGEDSDKEDSDRPSWAGTPGKTGKPGRGNTNPGVSKGDTYGDMYVLLRDKNGVPILTPEGYVQPVDAQGNPIPLDAEGHVTDESATVPVELSRLNVGRSPKTVLTKRLDEAISNIDQAQSVTLDAAGRIEYTVNGETKTVDAPLENLALYVKLMNTGTLGLSLSSSTLGSLAYLNDGKLTSQDLVAAASFLAAASDKYTPLTVDSVAYMDSILGVQGTIVQGSTKYVDFSTFSYDRSSTYSNVTADVLVKQADGTYKSETVNVYETVFGSKDYTSTSGIAGFAQAADDARTVIAYVHDNGAPE